AATALGLLEDRQATWSAHQMDRAAGIVLREGGWRVDEVSIRLVADTMVAHPGLVRLTPEVPAGPATLEAAGVGMRVGVFARVGEDRWTSRSVLEGEARLQALAAAPPARSGPRGRAREVLEGTEARLAVLQGEREALVAGVGAGRAEEGRLRGQAGEIRAARPAYSEAAGRVEAARVAAERADAVRARLAGGGIRKARQAERVALRGELDGLLAAFPTAGSPAGWRAEQDRQALLLAEAVDLKAVAGLVAEADTVAATAARAERRTAVVDADLVALRAAHDQLAAASAVTLGARREGLSAEQAVAVARLADPARVLDALVGPAGAGKTTTLAALAGVAVDEGRQVIGLAPTAAAAAVLGEDLGVATDTLDKALVEWRAGRGLPETGCVVIVDEASMAATPKLVEAVDTVLGLGGTVRLAGDPRQLGAVGAGGGLGIVANVAASPRLGSLHRFAQGWEGPATLRLRDRDPDVIETYARAGRVTGGGRHAMIAETFQAWSEATGRGDAIMVAADNTTVASLSAMARAARVETGHVNPDGVELANGSIAGVGDVIATRRNDRTIPVGHQPSEGGYVRNRDRWTVTARGDDGSLDVTHLRTGAAAQLPPGYVADHVELGYALTAHGAQGMTVDEAHVLVGADDPAAVIYVGMTRGRQTNCAHVVIDEPADEPGHLSPTATLGPVEVLARALANEGPGTATAVAHLEAAHGDDPAVLAARYLAVIDEDRRARLARAAGAVGSDVLAGETAWKVMAAAARYEQSGKDPARVIAELGADTTVERTVEAIHPGPLTADQILAGSYAAMGAAGQGRPLVAGILPPVSAYADPAVAVWAADAAGRLEALRARLAEDLATSGEPPPWAAAWGGRPHDPAQIGPWARAAAQVALYREAAGITEPDDLLGPDLADSNPLADARNVASRAARTARQITSPQPVRGPSRPTGPHPGAGHDPHRPGPGLGGHDHDDIGFGM
ncbi:MAG: AAA family ATPase, partial [Acidimicrobiales bacterium]